MPIVWSNLITAGRGNVSPLNKPRINNDRLGRLRARRQGVGQGSKLEEGDAIQIHEPRGSSKHNQQIIDSGSFELSSDQNPSGFNCAETPPNVKLGIYSIVFRPLNSRTSNLSLQLSFNFTHQQKKDEGLMIAPI